MNTKTGTAKGPAFEAAEIVSQLGTEVYFGLNLAIVLLEASPEERAAFLAVIGRAKEAREKLAARRTG